VGRMAGCLEGRAVKRTGPRRTALPRKVVSAEQDHDLEVDTTKLYTTFYDKTGYGGAFVFYRNRRGKGYRTIL
jgi:hypothetical protein